MKPRADTTRGVEAFITGPHAGEALRCARWHRDTAALLRTHTHKTRPPEEIGEDEDPEAAE